MPCCQHIPHYSCELLSAGRRPALLEYQEVQAQLSEVGSGQAVLFCVPFQKEDWGHQADIKRKQEFPTHGNTREQLIGALY